MDKRLLIVFGSGFAGLKRNIQTKLSEDHEKVHLRCLRIHI